MSKEKRTNISKYPMTAGGFMRPFFKNIATLWFVGYLPVAPGTWGTAAGLIFVALLPVSPATHLAIIAAGIIIGAVASGSAERLIGETDSGHIVIDEFIGFLVSVTFVPHTYGYLAAAFLLFRFFDILKPFPIGKIERAIKGGAGIMADDILAGVFTNAILQIWKMNF